MKNKLNIKNSGFRYLPANLVELDSLAGIILDFQYRLENARPTLHFGEVKVETIGNQHVFEVLVYLYDLDPKVVHVELIAEGINGGKQIWQELKQGQQLEGTPGCYNYSGTVPAIRPVTDYLMRLMPDFKNISVPIGTTKIIWLR